MHPSERRKAHCEPVSGMPKDPDRRRRPAAVTSMGGLAVPPRYRAIGDRGTAVDAFDGFAGGLCGHEGHSPDELGGQRERDPSPSPIRRPDLPAAGWSEVESGIFADRDAADSVRLRLSRGHDLTGQKAAERTGCVFRWKWATDSGGKWATIPVGSGPAFRWEAGHFCRCDRNGGPVDRNGTFEEGWRR